MVFFYTSECECERECRYLSLKSQLLFRADLVSKSFDVLYKCKRLEEFLNFVISVESSVYLLAVNNLRQFFLFIFSFLFQLALNLLKRGGLSKLNLQIAPNGVEIFTTKTTLFNASNSCNIFVEFSLFFSQVFVS